MVSVYIHRFIYIYIHTHTHTHTQVIYMYKYACFINIYQKVFQRDHFPFLPAINKSFFRLASLPAHCIHSMYHCFLIIVFIYFWSCWIFAAAWACSCGEQESLYHFGVWAFHCGGFSWQSPGSRAHGLQ